MTALPAGAIPPRFDHMPPELRERPRWVVWKGQKVPFCAVAVNSTANCTDPLTWATFDQAQLAYDEGGYSGVGFVLNGDGIVGVDLDKCVEDGEPRPAAMALLRTLGCAYVELSPSGSGLRGFGYGEVVKGRKGVLDGINIELYADKRYLTVTGHALQASKLMPLQGFAQLAERLKPAHLQKCTEDNRSHPLFSSVGIDPRFLPQAAGERNKRLFEFARHLKGVKADATLEELRAIVQEWHARALPFIGTKDFTVTWGDFLRGWDAVKYPHGEAFRAIVEAIDHTQPLPPAIQSLGYGKQGLHLVRICRALQSRQAEEPFFLAARSAGAAIGVHYTDAAKMLSALVRDGVLQLVSRGSGLKASRYRMP